VRHAAATAREVRRVLVDGCRFVFLSDVRAEPVGAFLAARREEGLSRRSSNKLMHGCRHFMRWAVRAGRASEDALASLAPLNERVDRRRERRALSADEQARLIEATRGAPERHGMTGEARAWLYRVALETGLRANELRSLRVASFEGLGGQAPAVRVAAAYSKRRREDVLPLRAETGAELAHFLRGRMPQAAALAIPHTWRSASMLREDLAAAGIPFEDEAGRVADFHSLRHSFVSSLAAGGVSPKVAQALARHSTVTLTLDRYTHVRTEDERAALDALPVLSATLVEAHRATGTAESAPIPAPIEHASRCTSVQRRERRTAFSAPPGPLGGSGGGIRTPDTRIMIPLL